MTVSFGHISSFESLYLTTEGNQTVYVYDKIYKKYLIKFA